jgi:hypothetical protein
MAYPVDSFGFSYFESGLLPPVFGGVCQGSRQPARLDKPSDKRLVNQ